MAKKEELKKEVQEEVKPLVFPVWLYSKNGAVLFKSKEQLEAAGGLSVFKDSPAYFEKEK